MFHFKLVSPMKHITFIFCSIVLATQLASCSSPEEKAAGYVANADALFEEGVIKKAEIEYKNALQINQNLPDAWYGLARIHERKQQWRKAYAALSRIREANPEHINGRIMLGQLLLASNQIDEALQEAKEIMDMAPNDVRVHSLMAAVQFRLENYELAQASVDRALEIDPTNSEAILVRARVFMTEKKYQQAISLLDRTIGSNPQNVSLYLMKIQAYQESGDQFAIEAVYKALVDQFPKNIGFRHALARYYIQANDLEKAEQILEKIVESDPDNIEEGKRLISFKYQYRSVDEAIALLQKFIDQNSKEYELRFNLGGYYEQNQNPEEAARVYQGIIDDDGVQANGLEARNKMALLSIKADEQEKAKEYVDEVLSLDKGNENALLLRSGFRISDRQYDDAVIDLRTVLRDNPNSIKAHALMGGAYLAMGSTELALESYYKAFEFNPALPAVANQLASIFVRQNNPKRADEILLKSMQQGNQSLDSLKQLIQVKLALQEWEQAEKLAQQLKKVEGQEALTQQVMGIVFQGREQQGESIDAFRRAHELAPESSSPIVALVRTYVKNGRTDDARQFLTSVISENGDNITAHLLLGQLNQVESKPLEAIEQYERVIEINPKLVTGYRNLAAVYIREDNAVKAEEVLLEGITAIPDSPALGISLASLYERQKAFNKAIKIYESLLEKQSDLIVARNNLASLLTDHRDDQDSLDRARSLAAEFRNSEIPQFQDTYAWAAVRSGINLEEAVVLLEGIVKKNDKVGVYHYHLGEAYRKKGDSSNASAYLEKAVELEKPDSDTARLAKQSLQQIKK